MTVKELINWLSRYPDNFLVLISDAEIDIGCTVVSDIKRGVMNLMGAYLLISQKEMKMNKCETTFVPADTKSMAYIGSESHKTIIAIDQHFNWFQKLMWKWCFGVKIEDCNKE